MLYQLFCSNVVFVHSSFDQNWPTRKTLSCYNAVNTRERYLVWELLYFNSAKYAEMSFLTESPRFDSKLGWNFFQMIPAQRVNLPSGNRYLTFPWENKAGEDRFCSPCLTVLWIRNVRAIMLPAFLICKCQKI